MAASCSTAVAVSGLFGVCSSSRDSLPFFRNTNVCYCSATSLENHASPSAIGRSKVTTMSRRVGLRVQRDPFADFSAGFVEDSEDKSEYSGSEGMTDEERDAIIAFETGGTAVLEDEQELSEDPWEEPSIAQQPKVYPPPPKKGNGEVIADMLTVFMSLLERPFGGDGRMIAAAGGAVTERVEEEVEALRGKEGVDEQYLFELLRVVRLIEMDLQLVSAARKDSTLLERLMQTAVHTKQALDIANSL